jgi:hypothetical protein
MRQGLYGRAGNFARPMPVHDRKALWASAERPTTRLEADHAIRESNRQAGSPSPNTWGLGAVLSVEVLRLRAKRRHTSANRNAPSRPRDSDTLAPVNRECFMFKGPRFYRVQRTDREPLVRFMVQALEGQGCRILYASEPTTAPFIITFETPSGERLGVVAYAFLATRTETKNRPPDERSFQVKYGKKLTNNTHAIWQDPFGLFTTVFVGISPERGYFIAADPEMHNPTKFFIRIEYKDGHAEDIKRDGWVAWERDRRGHEEPVEVLVGGTAGHFLDLIKFERAAHCLDQGNRQLLAERPQLFKGIPAALPTPQALEEIAQHPLLGEFQLSATEVLDVIANARRLKMAVRGWVAEEKLRDTISKLKGITHCGKIDAEGGPDLEIRVRNGPLLTVECKNVLRVPNKNGIPRLDFQRTRASKKDPCSRFYAPTDFDVVAACLHARTEQWEFKYILPSNLGPHSKCTGKLTNNVLVGDSWSADPMPVFQAAAARAA